MRAVKNLNDKLQNNRSFSNNLFVSRSFKLLNFFELQSHLNKSFSSPFLTKQLNFLLLSTTFTKKKHMVETSSVLTRNKNMVLFYLETTLTIKNYKILVKKGKLQLKSYIYKLNMFISTIKTISSLCLKV